MNLSLDSLCGKRTHTMTAAATVFAQQYLHGTRAQLSSGDLIVTGLNSNFRSEPLSWVYFTATLDTAIWGAELAMGESSPRIYLIEPTGDFFDDPNVTDKRFPGNPTRSYRSREPLRVVAEVVHWQGHSSEVLQQRRKVLAELTSTGKSVIID
jgi:rifampin ADP-ribosylating transferase